MMRCLLSLFGYGPAWEPSPELARVVAANAALSAALNDPRVAAMLGETAEGHAFANALLLAAADHAAASTHAPGASDV